MKQRLLILFSGLVLLCAPLSGALAQVTAAEPGSQPPLSPESLAGLIGQADAARHKAAKLGAEWLDTRSLIEQARLAAGQGELQRARELAELARQQGELAAAQAVREAEAWQRRVIR